MTCILLYGGHVLFRPRLHTGGSGTLARYTLLLSAALSEQNQLKNRFQSHQHQRTIKYYRTVCSTDGPTCLYYTTPRVRCRAAVLKVRQNRQSRVRPVSLYSGGAETIQDSTSPGDMELLELHYVLTMITLFLCQRKLGLFRGWRQSNSRLVRM